MNKYAHCPRCGATWTPKLKTNPLAHSIVAEALDGDPPSLECYPCSRGISSRTNRTSMKPSHHKTPADEPKPLHPWRSFRCGKKDRPS